MICNSWLNLTEANQSFVILFLCLQVMNVDGCIGAIFLDLLASSGVFSKKDADEIVQVRIIRWGAAS